MILTESRGREGSSMLDFATDFAAQLPYTRSRTVHFTSARHVFMVTDRESWGSRQQSGTIKDL